MRALVADSSAADRIAFHDLPEPVPATGEVLVEVRAFSINRGELKLLRAKPDGWRPGWDFAGIVQSDVEDGPRAGARVVGIRRGATWAERVAVPEASIAELPDAVSFAQAAALPTAGLAALRMLRIGPTIIGRRVLITGATGGVGRFAIQLAHLGGAHVTALVASSSTRAAGLHELGADEVLSEIGQLRGRFDLILESVGGDTLGRLVTMVDPSGTLVMFGTAPMGPPRSTFRTSSTMASSDSRGSSCSSAASRSGVTLGTSRHWWPAVSSIHSSRASCLGRTSPTPWSDCGTDEWPESLRSRSAGRCPADRAIRKGPSGAMLANRKT